MPSSTWKKLLYTNTVVTDREKLGKCIATAEFSREKPEHSHIDANGTSEVTQCDVIQRRSLEKNLKMFCENIYRLLTFGVFDNKKEKAFVESSEKSFFRFSLNLSWWLCNIRPICRWAANALSFPSFPHIAQAQLLLCIAFFHYYASCILPLLRTRKHTHWASFLFSRERKK